MNVRMSISHISQIQSLSMSEHSPAGIIAQTGLVHHSFEFVLLWCICLSQILSLFHRHLYVSMFSTETLKPPGRSCLCVIVASQYIVFDIQLLLSSLRHFICKHWSSLQCSRAYFSLFSIPSEADPVKLVKNHQPAAEINMNTREVLPLWRDTRLI